MQRNYRNLRLKFMSYWHRLITPFLRIEDAEQQRFAVRVAIMLACAILATSFLVVITRLGVSVFPIVYARVDRIFHCLIRPELAGLAFDCDTYFHLFYGNGHYRDMDHQCGYTRRSCS